MEHIPSVMILTVPAVHMVVPPQVVVEEYVTPRHQYHRQYHPTLALNAEYSLIVIIATVIVTMVVFPQTVMEESVDQHHQHHQHQHHYPRLPAQ